LRKNGYKKLPCVNQNYAGGKVKIMEFATLLAAPLPTPPSGTLPELTAGAIGFLSQWIGRSGGMVAFIGAVKLALSIKSEDAREQVQALLVMVSGFMIVAAVTNLDLFSFVRHYCNFNRKGLQMSVKHYCMCTTSRI
jgi:hypothetical protein